MLVTVVNVMAFSNASVRFRVEGFLRLGLVAVLGTFALVYTGDIYPHIAVQIFLSAVYCLLYLFFVVKFMLTPIEEKLLSSLLGRGKESASD